VFKGTYDKVRIDKNFSYNFPIHNGLKDGDALSPLLFNFALESVIKKVQEKQVRLKLNGTYQLLVYPDDVNVLGDNIDNDWWSRTKSRSCYGGRDRHAGGMYWTRQKS
jgi:hypothetical protein